MRGLLRSLDAGNPRSCKDVPLGDLIFRNQIECLAAKSDFSSSDSCPRTQRLCRNIDHLRATVVADMGEALHNSAADCDHFAAWLVVVAKVVLLRFPIDNVEKEMPEFLITCAGP